MSDDSTPDHNGRQDRAAQGLSGSPARPCGPRDLICTLVPAAVAAALVIWFRPLLTSGLWWDEQWRAYHVVLPGLHLDLGGTYAPTSPAWLMIEKLAVFALGLREWALRTPGVVAWVLLGPLTYRLCRRAMGRVASVVAATTLAATPAIVYFSTELKPYAMETLATVVIILAWARAHETRGIRRLLWYGVMAVVSLVSVPALFVVAPLLLLDAVRALLHLRTSLRYSAAQLAAVGATAAGVVVPLVINVLPQHAGDEYSYFRFLPHTLWGAISSATRDVGELLAGAWTSATMVKTDTRLSLPPPSHPLFAVAEWGLAVLVVVGGWHLRRSPVGHGLVAVMAGAIALQTATSLLHKWPLGVARVNLFLLPVIYVLSVAGLESAWQHVGRFEKLAPRAGAVAASCAGIALLGAIFFQNGATTEALHSELPLTRWAQALRTIVEEARNDAEPSSLAVVQMDGMEAGFFSEPPGAQRGLGWIFYMDHYGYAAPVGPRISMSRTYFSDIGGGPTSGLSAFIRSHPDAASVVEYAALGGFASGEAGGSLLANCIRSFGFEPYWTKTYLHSGQLTLWHRRHPARQV